MDSNLLQRLLRGSKAENIKFLGDQPTGSPEFTVAKAALEHRIQKALIWPNWILALATIGALLITIYQIYNLERKVNDLELKMRQSISASSSGSDKL